MKNPSWNEFSFLKNDDIPFITRLAVILMGIPEEELESDFVSEIDRYISTLEPFLQNDLRAAFRTFNSRLISFFFVLKFSKFARLSDEKQVAFTNKWRNSRIGLFRTAFVSLKSLCNWAYYSSESGELEMGHLGKTIGREKITPTLLQDEDAID